MNSQLDLLLVILNLILKNMVDDEYKLILHPINIINLLVLIIHSNF